MRTLTNREVDDINKISNLNSRKDAIQNLVITEWINGGGNGIFTGFTSIGKSFTICKIIKITNKDPDKTICVIVPTTDLKTDLLKDINTFGLKNVEVYVVNSLANALVKRDEPKYYDVVIADEIHSLCGANSVYFSEIIPRIKRKHFFGVSATLERDHVQYLNNLGLNIFFDVPLEDGYRTNVIPEYCIYNIPVELTDKEKEEYFLVQRDYQYVVDVFTKVNPYSPVTAIQTVLAKTPKGKPRKKIRYDGTLGYAEDFIAKFAEKLGKSEGQIIGLANTWRNSMMKRRAILGNCENSILKTIEIANYIKEQAIIVCSKIDIATSIAKALPSASPYHSKLTPKQKTAVLAAFANGELNDVAVVNSLKMGYNNDKIRFLIRQGYTSKALDLTQFLGRLMRPDKDNPDKFSILINVYVNDFEWKGKMQMSQQKKWLVNALWGRNFVEWVDVVQQIKL